MGFWGSLGKIALKAAPFAAMAIPGVGPLASALIQGGLGAANAKASGGGWKDALIGGGIGAATGGLSKGLGPSNPMGMLKGDIAKVAAKATGKSALGSFAKQAGSNVLSGMFGPKSTDRIVGINGPIGQEGQNPNFLDALSGILGSRNQTPNLGTNAGLPPYAMNLSDTAVPRNGMMRGLGPTMGQMDQNNPNLALSIGAGRQEALRNQPWRGGYEINYLGSDDETPFKTNMPPIYPNTGRRKRQKES